MRPRAPQFEFSEAPPRSEVQRSEGRRSAPVRSGPVRSAPVRPTELTTALQKLVAKLTVAAIVLLAACMPPTPAQKATDAARELNMAARWGRMNEAINRTDPKERAEFAKRHANWHTNVRIVETELAGLNMKDATTATIQVDVSWMFSDDPTLRVTRLEQEWSDAEGKWVMLSEEKLSGDPGLFGEEVEKAEKSRDKHFPSRVIH